MSVQSLACGEMVLVICGRLGDEVLRSVEEKKIVVMGERRGEERRRRERDRSEKSDSERGEGRGDKRHGSKATNRGSSKSLERNGLLDGDRLVESNGLVCCQVGL